MNILRLAGELLVIYIVYKIVFDFIIPIYNTTSQIKGKMNDMQERMQQQQRAQAEQQKQYEQELAKRTKKLSSDDYIDYEEVKG